MNAVSSYSLRGSALSYNQRLLNLGVLDAKKSFLWCTDYHLHSRANTGSKTTAMGASNSMLTGAMPFPTTFAHSTENAFS